ncbi:MAG: hypothetical protein MUO29_00210 [Desulfobacterales bacterium]|nr:hypothetical protein [Desulfobacterales bacterium]
MKNDCRGFGTPIHFKDPLQVEAMLRAGFLTGATGHTNPVPERKLIAIFFSVMANG